MGKYTQAPHRIAVETPLGDDVLYLVAFDGHEEYSRMFTYNLEMFSDNDSIAAKDIVGKNVTITVNFPDSDPRYINGFVSRFANVGTGDRGTSYRAEVVPWLWFLTQTADCRIFQEKKIPDIVEKIFTDLGFTDFEKSEVKGTHPPREYCVQYRETDYNFVCRLMEEEGIFFYFRHEQGKHTLVMGDHAGAYKDAEDNEIEFTEKAGDTRNDNIKSWEHKSEFRPGKWMHTGYYFEKPNTTRNPTYEILKGNTKTVIDLDGVDKYEIYDYVGEFREKSDSQDFVKLRMEQEEVDHDTVSGTSICRSFNPCAKFKVTKHRCKGEEGKSYVITSVSHSARVGSYITGGGAAENTYVNAFTCVPDSVTLRPARATRKPIVHGVQTAVVVGPPGEEIWPDKYGRVKVQFHWDREGKMDDKSSCWMRVAQMSAGKTWGAMAIPRIGQEVVVTHLEGDPDQPLITGSVYNAAQMPSRKLPDEKTKTYLKTNTSPGGSGHNELLFEDKDGKEQVYLHGEKDVDVRCKNNYHEIIGYEKEDGSFRQLINQDKEITVKNNQIEKIDVDQSLLVGGNSDSVVKGDKKEHVKGDNHVHVGGAHKEKVDGGYSLQTMANQTKVTGDYAVDATGSVHIKAGMTLVLEAGLQVSLKVGGNFVDISPIGVAINGVMVLINSGGAAGSGAGSSPESPEDAKEAAPTEPKMDDFSETGQASAPS